MKKLSLLFIICAVCLLAENITAQTYVNSATGNDGSGNGSAGSPYKTFTKGYAMVASGGTLDLTGTFTWTDADETGDAQYTGYTIAKNLTIQGHGPGNTIAQAHASPASSDRRVFTINNSITVTFRDLSIKHGKSANFFVNPNTTYYNGGAIGSGYGTSTGVNLSLYNVNIQANYDLTGNYAGVYCEGIFYAERCAFQNNTGKYSSATALELEYSYTNNRKIINCTFYNNTSSDGSACPAVYVDRYGATFMNCTFISNTAGIKCYGLTNNYRQLLIVNCILANSLQYDLYHYTGGNANGTTVYNSIVETELAGSTTISYTNCLRGDQSNLNVSTPTTNGSDNTVSPYLPLLAGSVAIDAGLAAGTTIGTDYTGGAVIVPCYDQRTLYRTASGTDMGSYEYGGTANSPTASTSVSTLTGFSYYYGYGPSAPQNFTISGTYLNANLTVTAPTYYEVSSSQSGPYSNTLAVSPTGGTITNSTVYIRLKSGYSSGSYNYSGTITGSCVSLTIACSGSIVAVPTSTLIWTGNTNTDWNTATNWGGSIIPTSSYHVIIPYATNYPIINQATTSPAICNNLTINSGAVLTIAAGKALTVNGTLTNSAGNTGLIINTGGSLIETTTGIAGTVNSAIPATEWHLISAPISNATSAMFTGKYLQTHSENTNAYTDITLTTDALTPGKGYAVYGDAGFPASYAGTLNTGNQTYSTTAASYSSPNGGWNLVGNPYPCSIDWSAASGWTKTNVNNAIYVHRNSSTWATFIGGVAANSGTRYIAPGQGFFIQATAAGTLAMTNAVKVHNATTFFKNADEVVPNLLRIEVSGNGYKDEAVVRFAAEATAEFDGNYDAHKLYGDVAEAAQVYTLGSIPLAINSLPATSTVPLGIYTGAAGTYTLTATEINDLTGVTLEDTHTGIFTDLTKSPCSVELTAGESGQRFVLHFGPLSIEDKESTPASIYSYRHTAYISMNGNTTGDIFIYTISGQLVATLTSASGMNEVQLPVSGTYIVKVVGDKTMGVKKVFIN